MGQETVGVYSFQGTLQAEVDRGQRVSAARGRTFSSHLTGAGKISSQNPGCHTEANSDAKWHHQPVSGVASQWHNTWSALAHWHFVLWNLRGRPRWERWGQWRGTTVQGRCVRPGFAKTSLSTFPICSAADFPFCTRECCSSTIVVFILWVVLGMLCGALLAVLAYDLQ